MGSVFMPKATYRHEEARLIKGCSWIAFYHIRRVMDFKRIGLISEIA